MTRDDLLKAYVALKSARAADVISISEYTEKVAALQYTSDDGHHYAIDADNGSFVRISGDGGAGGGSQQPKLPEEFLPLLAVIFRKTIATFLRRLPVTIIFGAAAMLLHTYYMVIVNEGFNASSNTSRLVATDGNILSSTVMWAIGSTLIMGVLMWLNPFGRKKKKITLRTKIEAVTTYLAQKKLDAFAVVAAGVGLTLVMGALVSGSANMSLAIGIGVLFASRAGSVVALLARAAWNTTFTTFRGNTTQMHGMAIGYVTLFATSIGFLLNSMMSPDGVKLGVFLLAGAFGFSLLQRMGLNRTNSFFTLLVFAGVIAAFAGLPIMAIADDGGWKEYMGNRPVTPENILIYLQYEGSIEALVRGLPAGVGAGIGAALAQALNALGIDFDVDVDMQSDGGAGSDEHTRILDGDAARDWLIRNGYYDANGNPTQKYHDWMNAPPSAPNPGDLKGLATNPDGSIVIVTADGAPSGSAEPVKDDSTTPQPDDSADKQPDEAVDQDADGQQDQSDDNSSDYKSPDWSLRNNPDPANMAWDPDTNSWRPKDDLHAEKMAEQGYDFDANTDSWRPPPKGPDLDEVPDHSDTKYTTEYKLGIFTYDITTDGLDRNLDDLDAMERDALDAYADLDRQIDEAEQKGDSWLADQLREDRDEVRDHLNNIQGQKTHIYNAINNENQRVQNYNDKIREPGVTGHAAQAVKDGYDIAAAIVNDPSLLTKDPDFVEKVKAGIAAAERVRKGEGIELRPGMFGYDAVKIGPSIADRFDDAMRDVGDINKLLEDAKSRGDTGAVEQLTKQLEAAKDHAAGVSNELQDHVQDVRKWQVKSANANLSIGRKAAEITAELASVPSTAQAVTSLVDDFNRGQGLFNKGTFRDSGDGMDIDLDTPSQHRPVRMTQQDIDLDAQFDANVRIGTERATRVHQVLGDPDATDAEVSEAINRALESRNSKLQLNAQPDAENQAFYDAVKAHRTTPLLERTSVNLNNMKASDGTNRFYVLDPKTGMERPVKVNDWTLVSGPKPRPSVGQDLDFYNPGERQIIDRVTGQPIKPEVVNKAIDGACDTLGINRRGQEINYTHSLDPEAFTLRPGQTVKQHIQSSSDFTPAESQQVTSVGGFKVDHAQTSFESPADGLGEGARAATKQQTLFVEQMIKSPKFNAANLPEYFSNPTSIPKPGGGYKSVLEVLADVGNDRIRTGTGQAAIRSACGRDIPTLNHDIINLPESLIKLRPPRP